jgi:DNA polymerase-3 subunit gamma/tau
VADSTSSPAGAGDDEQPWQSLYRRYRPTRFEEVRGQDHVTLALRNAVRDSRVSHAYLFSGPRGTGKTSTARILAKALNCADPVDGEPCSHCDSCLAIARGASFDVHELDAASNNGVEAMRDLVARAALSTPGRWKVYIVDEVHMLSTAASNALLKTLEEPPGHVVFVLATTDPQKVLATIRSRTQHFEFHLLQPEVLGGLLGDVAKDAGLDLPDGAVDLAIRRGRGSARDALSVLDQVAAAGITEDEVPAIAELLTAIAERDTARALAAVAVAIGDGRDVQRLAIDLVEQLRRGFLLLAAPAVATRLDATLGEPDAQTETVRELGLARCVRAIEVIGTTQVDMRTAADPRITFEVALARLTHPEADDSPAALLERLERLERGGPRTAGGGEVPRPAPAAPRPAPVPPPAATAPADPSPAPADGGAASHGGRPALGAFRGERPAPPAAAAAEESPPPARAIERPAPAAEPEPRSPAAAHGDELTRDDVVAAWGDRVLNALRPKAKAMYSAGRFLAMEGRRATFALPNSAHVRNAEAQRDEVAAALSSHFGRPIDLALVVDPGGGGGAGRASEAGERRDAPAPEAEPEPDESTYFEELRDRDSEAAVPKGRKDTAISLATDRLLQAFPGAEEV